MKRTNEFRKIYDSDEYINVDEPPIFPFIIDIELTNHCNLNCLMCSRQIMTREKGYMSRETFNKIMNQCKERDVGIRFIRWGEPFLHPHILDFCKEVKKEHPLHITTNGTFLTESQMQEIIDIEVDSIIFSMQGLTEKEYKDTRGEQYIIFENNIKLLNVLRGNKDKPYITVTTTYTPFEGTVTDYINDFKETWYPYADDVRVGITNMMRLTGEKPQGTEYIQCKEPYQKLGIDWDGKVTACCGDYDNLLTIGNVNASMLYNLWNFNDILDSIRTLLAYDKNRYLTLCNKCYLAYENFND